MNNQVGSFNQVARGGNQNVQNQDSRVVDPQINQAQNNNMAANIQGSESQHFESDRARLLSSEEQKIIQGKTSKKAEENQNNSKVSDGRTKLGFDGYPLALFRIRMLNMLLMVVTLGIYYFWGKTRVRQYITSSFTLLGDRFEYTGTGKELLKGFLLSILIFATLIIFYFGFVFIVTKLFGEGSLLSLFLCAIVWIGVFSTLTYAAIYSMTAYRNSRITWHSIHGGLDGSAWDYAFFRLSKLFLNMVTLGIAIPYSDVKINAYMTRHSYIGDVRCEYEENMGNLFKINIITLLLAIPSLGISRFWYRAALIRNKYASTKLGSLRFTASHSGSDLLLISFLKFITIVATGGMARPFTTNLHFQYFAKNITIIGDINADEFKQSLAQSSTVGEGLSAAFDMNFGGM